MTCGLFMQNFINNTPSIYPNVSEPESPMNIFLLSSIFPNMLKYKKDINTPISPAIKIQYTHICSKKNPYKKPDKAINDKPADKPSMPSIRFMAFIMNTSTITVNGAPIQKGISCMVQNPYMLLIYSHDIGNSEAEKI